MEEGRQPIKKSLLEKYEIPLDHLSYEYIKNCKDIKGLEKIIRILRSGQEGYYPDLQNAAEESLRFQNPGNRLLRKEEPALTRSTMSKEDWNNITSDLSNWKEEVSERDQSLAEEKNNTTDEITLAPVRQPSSIQTPEEKVAESKATRAPRVSDYAAWDKYDVATELLKVDLDEEREEEKKKQQQQMEKEKPQDTAWLEQVVKEAEKLTKYERMMFAEKEKLCGNEYYRNGDFKEAIKRFTASIAVWPTSTAYNNRAGCYLKQKMYTETLADIDLALKLESGYAKARHRRAIALHCIGRSKEALADMEFVVNALPKNAKAVEFRNDLREWVRDKADPNSCHGFEHSNSIEKKTEVYGCAFPWDNCIDHPKPPKRPIPEQSLTSSRIVELDNEPEVPKKSSKLKIIEVENSESTEHRPKIRVADKRTKTNVNADPTNVHNEETIGDLDKSFVKESSDS